VPIWLIVVLVVIVVLAVGGAIARTRQLRRTRGAFERRLAQADHDLALAAAEDRGWERSALEGAARRLYAEQRGSEPAELSLIEVVDRPGTDEDLAVFHTRAEGAEHRLTLGRRGGQWILEAIE
jgi:hypothetical protein